MHAVEFTAELSGAATLPIPDEVAAQLPKTGRARIIVLTEERSDADRQAGSYEQLLRSYSQEDARRIEADEAEWDRLFNNPEKMARFAKWAEQTLAEHPAEPFDESRL